VENPSPDAVPEELGAILERGEVFGTRVDLRRQGVLYMGLVAADARTAAESSTRPLAFVLNGID
jgi:hypothetical protein